jgi:uncharacterized protein
MSKSPFEPVFSELPQIIPIFPLPGVLVLPGGKLPLNLFEPRYLAMAGDALAGNRMIGMIQPLDPQAVTGKGDDNPPVYPTGCGGRITQFSETDDGRYLVTLHGLCRFRIMKELPLQRGYRRVIADWNGFEADMAEQPAAVQIDRDRLVRALKSFFHLHQIKANWDAIKETPDDRLITSLAMVCPFAPNEKQALLECPDGTERARVMTALMEMALLGSRRGDDSATH